MIKVILSFLMIFSFSNDGIANCEMGISAIHTIAEYRKSNLKKAFLVAKNRDLTRTSIFKDLPFDLFEKVYTVKTSINDCKTLKLIKHKNFDVHYGPHYTVVGCPDFPNSAIIEIDHEKSEVIIPTELVVKMSSPEDGSFIEKVSAALISKTGFTATSSVNGKVGYGTIEKSDIVNLKKLKFTHTQIGSADQKFISSTTNLKIKNYGKYLANVHKDKKYVIRLNELLVNYPILLFTFGENTIFFGDGSPCLDYDSYMAAIQKKDNSDIVVSEFKITSAFDLSGNGFPDIIVVNNDLIYLVDSEGKFYVVSSGIAC